MDSPNNDRRGNYLVSFGVNTLDFSEKDELSGLSVPSIRVGSDDSMTKVFLERTKLLQEVHGATMDNDNTSKSLTYWREYMFARKIHPDNRIEGISLSKNDKDRRHVSKHTDSYNSHSLNFVLCASRVIIDSANEGSKTRRLACLGYGRKPVDDLQERITWSLPNALLVREYYDLLSPWQKGQYERNIDLAAMNVYGILRVNNPSTVPAFVLPGSTDELFNMSAYIHPILLLHQKFVLSREEMCGVVLLGVLSRSPFYLYNGCVRLLQQKRIPCDQVFKSLYSIIIETFGSFYDPPYSRSREKVRLKQAITAEQMEVAIKRLSTITKNCNNSVLSLTTTQQKTRKHTQEIYDRTLRSMKKQIVFLDNALIQKVVTMCVMVGLIDHVPFILYHRLDQRAPVMIGPVYKEDPSSMSKKRETLDNIF
jgi:hypothetical protein